MFFQSFVCLHKPELFTFISDCINNPADAYYNNKQKSSKSHKVNCQITANEREKVEHFSFANFALRQCVIAAIIDLCAGLSLVQIDHMALGQYLQSSNLKHRNGYPSTL